MKRAPKAWIPSKPTASWWTVVIAGSLVVVFGVAIVRELIRSRQVRDQVQRLRDQVTAEMQRHDQLQELIAYLGSQTFQEREARLKLGLRKPGERVIVVPPESVPSTNNTNGSTGAFRDHSPETNPQRWWRFLFNRPETAQESEQTT